MDELKDFIETFEFESSFENDKFQKDGVFGYMSYDSVKYLARALDPDRGLLGNLSGVLRLLRLQSLATTAGIDIVGIPGPPAFTHIGPLGTGHAARQQRQTDGARVVFWQEANRRFRLRVLHDL